MIKEEFINQIKEIIREKNIPYNQIAKDIGCTYNSLWHFFQGKNTTSKIIFGLCDSLGLTIKIYKDEKSKN